MSLNEERNNNNLFSTKELNDYLCNGEKEAEIMKLAYTIIERDPILFMKGYYDWSEQEQKARTMEQIKRLHQILATTRCPRLKNALLQAMSHYSETLTLRLQVHELAVKDALRIFGTSEQQEKFLPKFDRMEYIGCYAMTELGHSSFLRGMETLAVFDKERNEFIIHSPTLTATKWWIGMAGHTATHGVVLCKLVIDGEEKGLHWFLIPLRNPANGHLLPGVSAGELGSKFGRNGIDNGWIQFTQHRIPRFNLLSQWVKVDPVGNFSLNGDPSISYTTLIPERVFLSGSAYVAVAKALTIACRYSCIRLQGNENQKIMDYQTHYVALVPAIAMSIALKMGIGKLLKGWEINQNLLESNPKGFLQAIPDFHAISAGLKSTMTWWAMNCLEDCRRACGGHSYSSYNGLHSIISDFSLFTTAGGDNYPLTQQTAKYLLKSFKKVMDNKNVIIQGSAGYLNNLRTIKKSSPRGRMRDSNFHLETLQWLSINLIKKIALSVKEGLPVNSNLNTMVALSRIHVHHFLLSNFNEAISGKDEYYPIPLQLREIMSQLCQLCGLYALKTEEKLLLQTGFFLPEECENLNEIFVQVCKNLRMYAVPLVDSFGFPDYILRSCIGGYDGNIYQDYHETLKNAPGCFGPPEYWKTLVYPMLSSNL